MLRIRYAKAVWYFALSAFAQPVRGQDIFVSSVTHIEIPHMSVTPNDFAETRLGIVYVETGSKTVNWIISNTDPLVSLEITGAITVTGSDAADFSVEQPAAGAILPGQDRTFAMTFDPYPGDHELRTAMISIPNNDPDLEAVYTFAVDGRATETVGLTQPSVAIALIKPLKYRLVKTTDVTKVRGIISVSNLSDDPVFRGAQLEVYYSKNGVFDAADFFVTDRFIEPYLAPNNSRKRSSKRLKFKQYIGPSVGTLFFRILPLPLETAVDEDYSDNQFTSTFSVL